MLAHTITLEVFTTPEKDIEEFRSKLLKLIPFDIEEEEIEIEQKTVLGFNEEKVRILRIVLLKKGHIRKFLKSFTTLLSEDTKNMIRNQAERRLDQELNFYIRFKKGLFLNEGRVELTDQGDCFFLKIKVAAFPKKRETALEIIDKIF
ncbi:MAG: hypothetical protein GF317_15035 [Candidatus Lokiarchaeota archaeon]|nr:hypothetical protein [Candidatus Lokiarchaeota archaeon]MBD3200902.1 hypothetical protein [Candidatus Lokiarchaeota archaeon]